MAKPPSVERFFSCIGKPSGLTAGQAVRAQGGVQQLKARFVARIDGGVDLLSPGTVPRTVRLGVHRSGSDGRGRRLAGCTRPPVAKPWMPASARPARACAGALRLLMASKKPAP